MIYVSISELIPEGFSYGRRGYTVGGWWRASWP